jgi:uroporphyrin-III C-methyltransferase
VAVVSEASLPTQRVVETTLARAAEDAAILAPPAIVVVGRVALYRGMLDWMAQAAGQAPRTLDPLGLAARQDAG